MAQCAATVWKRGTYRRTGRGKDGFEMYYERCRCKRKATKGKWCWQHDDTYSDDTYPDEGTGDG